MIMMVVPNAYDEGTRKKNDTLETCLEISVLFRDRA